MSIKISNKENFHNYIINGGFDFWQRIIASTRTIGTSYDFGADRWATIRNGTWTVNPDESRDSSTLPSNSISQYSHYLVGTPGATATTTNIQYRHRIEGRDAAQFLNSLGAFSFDFQASTNAGGSAELLVEFNTADVFNDFSSVTNFDSTTISTPNDDLFYRYSYNIDSFPSDIKNGLEIVLTWRNLDNGVSVEGWLADVCLTRDIKLLKFIKYGNEQQELTACQRFYEKSYNIETSIGTSTNTGAAGGNRSPNQNDRVVNTVNYKTTKINTPTLVIYSVTGTQDELTEVSGAATPTVSSIVGNSQTGYSELVLSASTTDAAYVWHWIADSEL